MKVEFNLVQNIFNTLPIGYYLGRKINVELSRDFDSYYVPALDKIVVGYASIAVAVEHLDETYQYDLEEIIRGLLYHEISHVLLSPAYLIKKYNKDFYNVFEDERIEVLLKNNYLNTNFRKNIIILNLFGKPVSTIKFEDSQTYYQAFFTVVRYHIGPDKFIKRVAEIIKTYKHINAASHIWEIDNYAHAISDLYNDVCKYLDELKKQDKQNNNQDNNQNNQGNPGDNDNNQPNNSLNNNEDNTNNNESNQNDHSSNTKSNQNDHSDESDNDENNGQSSSDENKEDNSSKSNGSSDETDKTDKNSNDNENSDGSDEINDSNDSDKSDKSDSSDDSSESITTTKTAGNESGEIDPSSMPEEKESTGIELTDEMVDQLIEDLPIILSDNEIKKLFNKALDVTVNKYWNADLTVKLNQIIEQKLKQKNKNGSAINSYSGRLNVKSVGNRDDYKWWAQQNRNGHIKAYSKVHFNLFIDNSGSFEPNDINMNKFIQALSKVNNPDFDFDIITINTGIVEWPSPTSSIFNSNGGTKLPAKIESVIKKHTRPRANNYNIVLFDGDASPERLYGGNNAFSFFDSTNTIIITDISNRCYLSKLTKAKIIITDDYCNKFIDATLNLLSQVL